MDNDALMKATVDLSEDRFRQAVAIRDWLLGDARQISDPNIILEGLCLKLRDAGVPVDRGISAVEFRHSERAANARVWERGKGAKEHIYSHAEGMASAHRRPLAVAHEKGEWVSLWLPDLKDEEFYMVGDLKAEGYVHHLSIPVPMLDGMRNGFTFATKSPTGFSADDVAVLRVIHPTLGGLMEILALQRILREVLRMYVGEEPHRRILSGDVRRGEVLRINAAILFADMRSYTRLTSTMGLEDATDLVNQYYDCVVPAVESRGGEILKFIGDGILAIFRAPEGRAAEACWRAYAAATAALTAVDERNAAPPGGVPFDVGIALHLGEVAYGNVGSGARLDYTVIGRDVNLGARIADLCGRLERQLLVSGEFAAQLRGIALDSLGSHKLKGLADPEEVLAPSS